MKSVVLFLSIISYNTLKETVFKKKTAIKHNVGITITMNISSNLDVKLLVEL